MVALYHKTVPSLPQVSYFREVGLITGGYISESISIFVSSSKKNETTVLKPKNTFGSMSLSFWPHG